MPPKKVFACLGHSFVFATYAPIAFRTKLITGIRLMYPSIIAKILIKGYKLKVWGVRQ